MQYYAAILAGGESSRFGADKAFALLNGRPLILHVAKALERARKLGVVGHEQGAAAVAGVLLRDPQGAVRGPAAGILAAMEWAKDLGVEWLVTAPCDAPLLPHDLAQRLIAEAEQASVSAAFAKSPNGPHPLCAAWRPSLAAGLRRTFARGEHPPVRSIASDAVAVSFPDDNAFLNINTPADLAAAERLTRLQ